MDREAEMRRWLADGSAKRNLTHPGRQPREAVGVRPQPPGGRILEVSQVQECKAKLADCRSIRAIAKELGVSRNTVRAYLRGERHAGEYRLEAGRPRPVSEELSVRVRRMLTAEKVAATPRKQRLTAARIGRVLSEQGLRASDSTIRAVVRAVRLELRDQLEHAYVPLVYAPGQDAQVDFYQGEIEDADLGRVPCFILLMRACYSSRTFSDAAPNQTREALLKALMLGFEHFGEHSNDECYCE